MTESAVLDICRRAIKVTGKKRLTNTKNNVNNTGMKNRKASYAHAWFVTYLFLNGLVAGHMVCSIRNIVAHGFDDKTGVDVTLTLGALALTSSRGWYWYMQTKDKEK